MQLSKHDQIKILINQFLDATEDTLSKKLNSLLPSLKNKAYCQHEIRVPALSWNAYFQQFYMNWLGFFFQSMESALADLVQETLVRITLILSHEANEATIQNAIMLGFAINLLNEVKDYLSSVNDSKTFIYMTEFLLRAFYEMESINELLSPLRHDLSVLELRCELLNLSADLQKNFKDANLLWGQGKDNALSLVAN